MSFLASTRSYLRQIILTFQNKLINMGIIPPPAQEDGKQSFTEAQKSARRKLLEFTQNDRPHH